MRRSPPPLCVTSSPSARLDAKSSNQPPCPQSYRDRPRIFAGYATPEAELAYELASRRHESSHRRRPANPISEEEML